jgi:uncharacterized membrane protein
MLPHPLHPAVIHFPIVLTLALPLVIGAALWLIRKGAAPRKAWWPPLGLAAALVVSSWVAVETGESEEEKVEAVVAESALEGHEEAANLFLVLSLSLLAIAGLGLVKGRVGAVARASTLAGALGLTLGAYQVGHSGGALVYQHGAASAYSGSAPISETDRREAEERESH